MTLPVYFTGTVSVTNLGTTVHGAGVMWSGINAREGDYFVRSDGVAVITEVTDQATLQITPWPGATVSGGNYAIEQNYVGRVVGVAAAEDVGVMLEKLHTDGLPFIVGVSETVPDPSYGDEGQFAFQPSTGKWWIKQGGIWVPNTGLVALGYGGTSTTSLLIGTGAKAFTTQTGLAYNGARVRAASAANLNNFMEGVSTYVPNTGALTMTCDYISGSGTHADWLFAVAGQVGAASFPDAPSDTVLYGRKSATVGGALTWTAAAGTGAPGGAIVSVTPPASPADGALWWESDTGILYLRYNDGNGPAQWVAVTATGGGGTGNAVRYDVAQGLTGEVPPYGVAVTQRSQARMNIYAAPFDALAYSGLQINGGFEISQEKGFNNFVTAGYTCDGWLVGGAAVGAVQSVAALAPGIALAGYNNALNIQVITAIPSLAAGDAVNLQHPIEGYRCIRLGWGTANAQPITIAFWSAHHRPGIYSVFVRNSANSRVYATTYNHNAADVWQYNVVTIPGDVAGTWALDNTVGMRVSFAMASGSSATAPTANAWIAGNYLGAPGQINGIAATTDVHRLAGVVVLPGIEAPSAARSALIMRPFDQELVTCQRYYGKSYDYASPPGTVTTNGIVWGVALPNAATIAFATNFKARMRTAALTMTLYSYNGTGGKWSTSSAVDTAAATASGIGENSFSAVNSSGLTAGAGYQGHWIADGRL